MVINVGFADTDALQHDLMGVWVEKLNTQYKELVGFQQWFRTQWKSSTRSRASTFSDRSDR